MYYQMLCTSYCPEESNMTAAHTKLESARASNPLVKEELRSKIHERRRKEGQDELRVDLQKDATYEMTPLDYERRERRKASNRRAAHKLRNKKLKEQEQFEVRFEQCQKENKQLMAQVRQLQTERDNADQRLKEQLMFCTCNRQQMQPVPLSMIKMEQPDVEHHHCHEQVPASPLQADTYSAVTPSFYEEGAFFGACEPREQPEQSNPGQLAPVAHDSLEAVASDEFTTLSQIEPTIMVTEPEYDDNLQCYLED